MAIETIKIESEKLKDIVSEKLNSTGLTKEDARIISDVLVYADLRGIHSHGVVRVEHYIQRINSGGMNLSNDFTIDRVRPSVAVVDANGAAGHIAMKFAMEKGIEIAKEEGLSVIGVKNNSHCGALAYFAEIALSSKKVALICGNVNKLVVPFGGNQPFFGSNPLAFAFPGEKENILLDMATSEVAWGKIINAQQKNEKIPENWALDKDGNSCTDPHQAASLLPFGGPKGYGITLMVECLTGLLVGGVYGPHLKEMYGDYNEYRNLSNFIFIIDPEVFYGNLNFLQIARNMIDELHQIPSVAGGRKVMIPGEIEKETMNRYLQEGIPVPKDIYNYLIAQN